MTTAKVRDPQGLPLKTKAIAALLLWSCMALPHLLPAFSGPGAWSWIVPVNNFDDQFYYLSQVNYRRHHDAAPGTPFLKEEAERPAFQPGLNQGVVAILTAPFGTRYRLAYLWIALLFCFAIVGAMAGLLETVFPSDPVRLFGLAGLILLGLDENLNRMIHPQANIFVVFVLGFWGLWKLWFDPKAGWPWQVLVVVASAVMVYAYPFYAIYFNITLGFMTFGRLAYNGFKVESFERRWLAVLACAAVAAIPFVIQHFSLGAHVDMAEIREQNGFLPSRFPSLKSAAFLFGSAALAALFLRGKARWFFLVCFASGLACTQQQIVSGNYIPDTETHFQHAYRFPIWFLLLYLANLKLEPLLRRGGGYAAAVLLSFFLIGQCRMAFGEERLRIRGAASQYRPAIDWLSRNAEVDSVVVSGVPASSLVVSLTPSRAFYSAYTYISLTPQRKLRPRVLAAARLYGLDADGIERYASVQPLPFWGYGFESRIHRERVVNLFRSRFGVRPFDIEGFKRERFDALREEFSKGEKTLPWDLYAADFVIYGPWERDHFPEFEPERFANLREIPLPGSVRMWAVDKS